MRSRQASCQPLIHPFEIQKSQNGSIYVDLDTGVSHYAKIILDEVFGKTAFRNEIIWKRSSAHSDSKQGMSQYGRVTDSLLFYTKRNFLLCEHVCS